MRNISKAWLFVVIFFFWFNGYSRAADRPSNPTSDFFIIEPYIGYEKGYLSQTTSPVISVQGVNYGARLGCTLYEIGIGLDYMMASQRAEQQSNRSDYRPTDYGVFLNYSLFGLKLYASYMLQAKSKLNSVEYPGEYTGAGYKIGVGWSWYSWLRINAEMINRKYTKYSGSKLSHPVEGSSAGVSISFPLLE